MSLEDLETAVTRLAAEDLAAFARWFEEYLADALGRPHRSGHPGGGTR